MEPRTPGVKNVGLEPTTEAIETNESILVAFAFTRAVLAIIILGTVALTGLDQSTTENSLLAMIFVVIAAIGFLNASQTILHHQTNKPIFRHRPWALITLDAALAIGVMAVLDAETSPLSWIALIVPVLETAVLFSMLPAAFVWVGLSLAFLGMRLALRTSEDPGVETLALAVQQVFAVLLVSGPAALLSDSAQQRIDKLADARRSADQIADRLRRIAQAASDMSQENSVESVLESVSHSAVTIGYDHADVVIVSDDGTLTSHGSHSSGPFRLPPLEVMTLEANEQAIISITERSEEHGQLLHTHEISSGHAVQISSDEQAGSASRAILRVWSKRRPSTEQELRALALLAGHAREIHHAASLLAEAKDHSRQLLHQVRHDSLTGLANRNYVLSTLEERIEQGVQIALFFIDLDGFKEINDTYGHRAGDAALTTVANRLRALDQPGALAGRMGGDEFIILLSTAVLNSDELANFGYTVAQSIAQPMEVDGHRAQLGASIGLAVHTSNLGADQLISQADGAMYEAKRSGGGLRIAQQSSSVLRAAQKQAS